MTIEEYFGTLQQSFVEIWKNHLQTDKYSAHKALNEYYDDIVEAVDKLIEDWMGIHGKVKDLTNTLSTEYDEPKEYLKALKKFAKEGRQELIPEEDTELWSDVDDILGLIDSTLYKLEELDESVNTSSLSRYLKESLNESYNIKETINTQSSSQYTVSYLDFDDEILEKVPHSSQGVFSEYTDFLNWLRKVIKTQNFKELVSKMIVTDDDSGAVYSGSIQDPKFIKNMQRTLNLRAYDSDNYMCGLIPITDVNNIPSKSNIMPEDADAILLCIRGKNYVIYK